MNKEQLLYSAIKEQRLDDAKRLIDDGAVFNGGADFRGCTSLTAIPEGTVFNNIAYFTGCTSLTTIPEGTVFNSRADFSGCTSLVNLPLDLTCDRFLFDGKISGYEFRYMDGICTVVLSEKRKGDLTIMRCRYPRFKSGKLVGRIHYVASNGDQFAHGKSAKDAIEDLQFKLSERNPDEWRNMPLDTVKTPKEWAQVYRDCTGACREGIQEFMSQHKLKRKYTLAEILEATKGAYQYKEFREVVCDE